LALAILLVSAALLVAALPVAGAQPAGDASSLLAEAGAAAQAGDVARALGLVDRAIQADPANAQSWLYKGMLLRTSGKPADAVEPLRKAVALNARYAAAWRELALACEAAGDAAGAQAALAKVVELDPADAQAKARLDALGQAAAQRAEVADPEAALRDFKAFGDSPAIDYAEKAWEAVVGRIVEMENQDKSKEKTITGTWQPHLKEMVEVLHPKAVVAAREAAGVRPRTPRVAALARTYAAAWAELERALVGMVAAIRAGDGDRFGKAIDVMKTAAARRREMLAALKTLSNQVNEEVARLGPAAPPDLAKVTSPAPAAPAHPVDIDVEAYSGALAISQPDIVFEGCPLPLGVVRHFRSTAMLSGPLGPGWSHDYDVRVAAGEADGLMLLFEPGGSVTEFRRAADGTFAAPRLGATLAPADGGHVLSRCTGQKQRFDADGRLVRIEEPGGLAVDLEYRGGLLRQAKGPFGQWVALHYGDGGVLVGASSSAGDKVGYVYDDDGRLTQVVSAGAPAGRFTYGREGGLATATFAAGRTWTVETEASGRVTSLTDSYGYRTRYSYASSPEFVEFATIAPNDARTTQRHFRDGSREVVIAADGATTVTQIDPATGLPAARTDAAGRVTAYTWDAAGRLAEVRDPAGRITRLAYHGNTPLPARVESADGNVVEMAYDARLNLTRTADTQRGTQTLAYDDAGRLVSLKDFDGAETVYTYGDGWLPKTVTTGGRTVTLEHDASGRPVAYTAAGGERQALADLRTKGAEAAKALLPRHDFARAGQEVASADGLMRYAFDAVGNLTLLVTPTGSRREFRYDAAGRLTQIVQDGRPALALAYDAVGNVTRRTLADGRQVLAAYDALDRPVELTYPDGSKTTLAYDAAGRVTEAHVGAVTVLAEYDARGRRTATRLGGMDAAVTCAYAEDGLSRTVRMPGGEVRYTYDGAGRLASVASEPLGEVVFTYDAAGRLAQRRYPNGVVETWSREAPRTTRQEVRREGEVLRASVTVRDEKGLTVKRTVDGKDESFAYDANGQLVQADTAAGRFRYAYDVWGNRTSEQADDEAIECAAMPDGRLAKRGRTTYEWDACGNLKLRRGPEGETAFAFDAENRLASATAPDGTAVTYAYDSGGLPVVRTVAGRTVYTLYDGLNPVADVEADGGNTRVVARFLYAPGVDEALGMVIAAAGEGAAAGPRVVFFHRDERNDVVLATDAQGRPVARYAYGPFGRRVRTAGEWDAPVGFGSHRHDAALGLVAMRARFYDPEAGRFLSPDPVRAGPEDGLAAHPYLYVRNSPMDFTDPLGLWGLPQWMRERAAIGAGNQETLAKDTAKDLAMNQVTGVIESQKILRVVPAEKLPFGVSKATLDASKNAVGVKVVAVPKPGAAQLADRIGAGWEVFKLTKEISDAYTGEDSVNEAQNKIVAATVGAELSIGIGAVAKVAGAATGPAGVAVAIVGGAVANEVKTAIVEGLDAWDAKIAAQKAEEDWQKNDLRLARDKMTQIREAVQRGDMERARQLNRGLNDFATSREGKVDGMSDVAMATLDLQSTIQRADQAARAARQQAERDAYEAQVRAAEAKVAEEQARQQAAAAEKEAMQQAAKQAAAQQAAAQQMPGAQQPPVQPPPQTAQGGLGVSLIGPAKPVQPGQKVQMTIRVTGGDPPFTVTGATSGQLQSREGTFEVVAPQQPGSYGVAVAATDAAGRTASAKGTVVVGRNAVQGTCRGSLTGSESGGSLTITVAGTAMNGTFSGRYGSTVTFSGTISGTYNPVTGAVSGTMSGRYNDTGKFTDPAMRTGALGGTFTGQQQGTGFAGSWHGTGGYGDSGSWSVSGGTVGPMP
jgi:RHS repeat-associated protein